MSNAAITEANGNTIKLLPNQRRTERESNVRRLAASLDRNHPAVDRITPGPGNVVNVWIVPGNGWENIHAPDGWEYHSVGIADTGGVCVEFKPEVDV